MDIRRWWFENRSTTPLGLIFFLIYHGRPNPFSMSIGISFMLLGEVCRIFAISASGLATRARKVCADFLTTDGIYRFTRNPIYFGNFLISCGFIILSRVVWLWPVFLSLFILQYSAIIDLEEEFLEKKFQDEFRDYKKNVPRFWPAIPDSNFISKGHQRIYTKAVLNEKRTLTSILILLLIFLVKMRNHDT
ncbi:methyltransferase family protein [Candidatus Riflebacteria bacterium]